MEKIICGGFELGEGLQMDGNVLNVTSSGGGLPPVTGSGKALVSVNGEWVEQDGYGYSETGGVETIANETVNTQISQDFGPYPIGFFNDSFELVLGDSYNVEIDGAGYPNLVAADIGGGSVGIVDGNAGTMENVTFAIRELPDGSYALTFIDTSKVGEHSVKIEHLVSTTVHKIDSKYLPANELPAYPTEDGSYVLTCTVASGVATLEWEAAESAG